MVVHQDQGGGVQLQRALGHLSRIDRSVVHRAALLRLVRQQPVAAIEEQHTELLDALARQLRAEIGRQPFPVGQHRLIDNLGAQQAQRRGLHRFQRRHACLAEPVD